jgi:hypothetical protein
MMLESLKYLEGTANPVLGAALITINHPDRGIDQGGARTHLNTLAKSFIRVQPYIESLGAPYWYGGTA